MSAGTNNCAIPILSYAPHPVSAQLSAALPAVERRLAGILAPNGTSASSSSLPANQNRGHTAETATHGAQVLERLFAGAPLRGAGATRPGAAAAASPSLAPTGVASLGVTTEVEPARSNESAAASGVFPFGGSLDRKKVLIIFTGGTIGMSKGEEGALVPQKGFLARIMKDFPEVSHPDVPHYDILEWDAPLDSSDFTPECWVLLAQQIADNYYSYDGFVILHGTDTMAYTASALSFMLENLGKAVVLTGSMIPLEEPVSDAKRNLLISMMVAAHLNITEVLLFFNTHLLRGNRAKKTDPWRLAAIESVNTEPLATMGVGIHMRTKLLLHPPGRRFNCHTQLYHNIIVLTMTPAFCYDSLKAMASSWRGIPGCEPPALVLLMFGSGNAPINVRAFQEAIDLCLSEKCPVVIMSQCVHGSVDLTQYEGGMRLAKMGVIDGKDMTVEACTTKLSYLMGRGLRGSMLKKAMETNLRGELEIKPTVSYTGFALGAQSYLAKL